MSKRHGVDGVSADVQFGKGNPRLKTDGTVFQSRNAADAAFVRHQVADATADDDAVTKRQLDAVGGITWDTTLYAATFTAAANKKHRFNGATFTGQINMPASPANGDVVVLKNYSAYSGDTTLSGNGNNVEDASTFSLGATTELPGGFNGGASYTYSYNGTEWVLE